MIIEAAEDVGLSPLARGNRCTTRGCRSLLGPIPAGAGQPCSGSTGAEASGAYPRWRGATVPWPDDTLTRAGLSPLARGNLVQREQPAERPGPIPAGAGQPARGSRARRAAGAYPRWRGATVSTVFRAKSLMGLSPLARGNREERRHGVNEVGPIPAGAGQPGFGACPGLWSGAYPRWRGATGKFFQCRCR